MHNSSRRLYVPFGRCLSGERENRLVCLLTKFIKKGVVDLPAGARAADVARWREAINTSNNIQCEEENNDDDPILVVVDVMSHSCFSKKEKRKINY